jgi:hypothetical protein
MSQRDRKRDGARRLRTAAETACARRGANVGTVTDVIDILHEENLLSSSVSAGSLRQCNKRARLDWRQQYCNCITLDCDDGSSLTWHVMSPHSALQYFLDHVDNFARLLRQHADGEPLQLLFYHDEVVPGNVLHPDNTRRSVAFYISFLEWRSFLHSECVWLPIALLRTQVIKCVTGGLSHCLAKLFQSWHDNFHGRPLTFRDSTIRFFPVQLAGCIMDESAMHATWCCKGSSGRRPCMKCKNCVAKPAGASLDLDDANYFRDICCPNITEFQRMTDQDAWESMDYLDEQQPTMSKKNFAELERNIGFNHSPNGLLAQRDLRQFIRPSPATFDLLHCFWNSGGIAPVEVGLFVQTLLSGGMSWDQIQEAAASGISSTHPVSLSSRKRLLSEPYFGSNVGWKASGSEHMMMMPLLHLWLMQRIHGTERWARLQDKCYSFQLLCERLYTLCALSWSSRSMFRDLLRSKQQAHYRQFLVAYGREHARPKHHYALHAPDTWTDFGFCLDTKTQERKHQVLKREIESSGQNLTGFEERMLRQLLLTQVTELNGTSESIGRILLCESTLVKPNHWQSSTLKQNLVTWKVRNVVIQHDLLWAGTIQCFERQGEELTVLIQTFQSARVIGLGLYEWCRADNGLLRFEWNDLQVYRPAHWILSGERLLTIW